MNKLMSDLRDKVVRLYDQAYPDSDRNAAWWWRTRNVGKGETSDWTLEDWQKAHEILRVKLGIPVRASSRAPSEALELPL